MIYFFACIGEVTCFLIGIIAVLHILGILNFQVKTDITTDKDEK